MTLDDFMRELTARFPNAPMKAWAPDYRRELGPLAGERLRAAFNATMGEWTEAYAPKPAHFLNALRPILAAREDDVVKAQVALREENARLARDKADPIKRAQLDALITKAKAHLSSASPPTRPRPTTIFKPLPASVVERIRKEHGQ